MTAMLASNDTAMPAANDHAGDGLAGLFNARSIALVGATERSVWSNTAWSNAAAIGFTGAVHLVNPKGGIVYGQAAATSCAAIGAPIDAALLMVPGSALIATLDDLQAAGIRSAVVLSSGFAETGAEGVTRQRELGDAARRRGIRLMGPNTLGFANVAGQVAIWTSQLPAITKGSIAIVSQSGATGSYISAHAAQQGLGLSFLAATGNEADIRIDEIIGYLVHDENTKCIVVFLEAVRNAAGLARAADKARLAGKPLIVIKIGTSAETVTAALAHTGSLVGDDRVFDAACLRHGMIRVSSIDEAIATAGLLSQVRPRPGRLSLMSISGGISEISADRADSAAAPLAKFAPATEARLRDALPDFGLPHNPLDVTGAAMLKPEMFADCMAAVGDDPGVGLSVCLFDIPDGAADQLSRDILQNIAAGAARGEAPALLMAVCPRPVTAAARDTAGGLPYIGAGLFQGLAAVGNAFAWTQGRTANRRDRPEVVPSSAHPRSEREALEYLHGRDVPVIVARLARTAAEAVQIAAEAGGPIAMKISSPDIAHKTEVGGVALDVQGDAAVERAFTGMLARVGAALPDAMIEGVLVSPMRRGGLELFVGVIRDPQWGLAITVGLGGIWVEVLRDTSLRLLPIDADDALAMLAELRGSALLDGYRGGAAVDRNAVAAAIVAIGDAALALGSDLVALEINPLLADGARVEALDALATWADPGVEA